MVVGKRDKELTIYNRRGTKYTGSSKNSVESDDLVKLVDRIGIIISSGEKNVQHAVLRINGLNNAWLVNSIYLQRHYG